ncbi:hypothetical protein [Lentibacillus sp. CBA3610]|uniref:hypothetical protein n=1 Tax=Lentibacillus sp. CBA3610 TaxID=2518176 RepID=UPI001C3ED58B|nr:hypothetical protein [Lentibacillus sp. CBA3610]
MAIVYQTDKRSGITYAYESISYWDKDKRQSDPKGTLSDGWTVKPEKLSRQTAEDGKIKRRIPWQREVLFHLCKRHVIFTALLIFWIKSVPIPGLQKT